MTGYVASMYEVRNKFTIVVGKCEGNRQFVRHVYVR